jgi:hypothetical protein
MLGLLAASDINTRMKAGPEPSWRMIAREKAVNAVSYAFVDSGPSDLSPYLPWIGTSPSGSVAMFPEDLRRTHAAAPTDLADVEADLALAEAAIRTWAGDVDGPAMRAAEIAVDLRRDNRQAAAGATLPGARAEPDRSVGAGRQDLPLLTQPIKFVEPAPLEIPVPAPVDEAAQAADYRLSS